jgi:CTP:molybdopterin cytidylyltransferase MocA
MAAALLPEIASLDDDVGLRELRSRHAEVVRELEVDDPGCVADLDTPDDYAALVALAGR